MFDDLREAFRENPRLWWGLGVAVLVLIGALWFTYGDFNVEIGRFFAAMDEEADTGGGGGGGGPTQTCGAMGGSCCASYAGAVAICTGQGATQNLGASSDCSYGCFKAPSGGGGGGGGGCVVGGTTCNGNKIFKHCTNKSGEDGEDCAASGKICQNNNGSVTVDGARCVAAGGGGSGGGPANGTVSGDCTYKTDMFNDPDGASGPKGAWYCKSLKCGLIGNPPGPPAGPAGRLDVKLYGTICDNGVYDTPTVGCTQRLDGTPKSGGQEGYPPKDPLWSCTGPIEMGRNGHDYYDCYVPRIHLTGPGQVTCTANTGLPGDSITFTVVGAGQGGPPVGTVPPEEPVATPPPSVTCSPAVSNLAVGERGRFTANATIRGVAWTGGYAWDAGDGYIEGGGKEYVDIAFPTAGAKTVKAGLPGAAEGVCRVNVGGQGTTGTSASGLSLTKEGRNTTTGGSSTGSVAVTPGQTVQFILRLTNSSAALISGVILKDTVPPGMTFNAGSVRIEGIGMPNSMIDGSGSNPVNVRPGATLTATWTATVDAGAPAQSSRPMATAMLPDGNVIASDMEVIVLPGGTGTDGTGGFPTVGGLPTDGGSGQVGGASGVDAGPGDAVLIALIVAAGAAFAYAGYTRSPGFRRREARKLGEGRDPLDFRP